jgi:hypothetical protein
MLKHIDGAYVAAQVRLMRQVQKGAILMVEGGSDAKVFENFIDTRNCDIEVGFGKTNVINAIDRLEDEGFPGVVAVVDADFDRLRAKKYKIENLYFTDKHDLDLTIFSTAALERYINEYSDRELYKSKFKSDISEFRAKMLNATLIVSCCRFISENQALGLYFKDFAMDKFISVDDLTIESDKLISAIISRSSTRCTEIELNRYITTEIANQHDFYQLSNGHDVATMVGISLRKLISSRRDVHTWASEIEAGLRLAFTWDEFIGTDMYKSLRLWESENKPYVIFRHSST